MLSGNPLLRALSVRHADAVADHLLQAPGPWGLRELARVLNLAPGSVARAVAAWEEVGLIEHVGPGARPKFTWVAAHPWSELVASLPSLTQTWRVLVQQIARGLGANVRVEMQEELQVTVVHSDEDQGWELAEQIGDELARRAAPAVMLQVLTDEGADAEPDEESESNE